MASFNVTKKKKSSLLSKSIERKKPKVLNISKIRVINWRHIKKMCAPITVAAVGGVVAVQAILAAKVIGAVVLGSVFVANYIHPLKRLNPGKVEE